MRERERQGEKNRDMTRVLRERKTDGDTESPIPPLGLTDRQDIDGHVYTESHILIKMFRATVTHSRVIRSYRFPFYKYILIYTHFPTPQIHI